MHRFAFLFCFALLSVGSVCAERLTPETLWNLSRVGDSAVSPDRTQLAMFVTQYDLEKNEGTTSLMLQPMDGVAAGNELSTAFQTPLAKSRRSTGAPRPT